jgi:dolichol-phosphate mannosyltransferase
MNRLSFILPTYNEYDNILILIQRLYASFPDAEIIVVDDDSPDLTWQAAQTRQQDYPKLKVFRRIHERGLTSAIRFGINASEGDIIGWMDCDLCMPPEIFKEMIRHMPDSDLVLGSRYVAGGGDDRSRLRRFSSQVINSLGQWALKLKTRDLTSGFILCKRPILERFPLQGLHGEYCIGLIKNAEHGGYNVTEIPYRFTERRLGKSKTNQSIMKFCYYGIQYGAMILRLRNQIRKGFNK